MPLPPPKPLRDPDWIGALRRVARARSSAIHMPAALLILLDICECGQITDGTVEFEVFEPRFAALMSVVCPAAADTAWEPFFHLSTTSHVWDLYRGQDLVNFNDVPGGRPKRRSRFVGRADRAKVVPELRQALAQLEAREAIRNALYAMLEDDADPGSTLLLSAHKRGRCQG